MVERLARRRWAALAAIVVAIYVFVLGFYSPPFAAPDQTGAETAVGRLWALTSVSAALALAAVFVSLRWPRAARPLLGAGGVVLLLALFTLETFGWYAVVGILLPGLVMLAAAPFLGRMPTPEQEGKPR